jgi:glycosyltransferase involved in cell wall biosynthesis
MKFYSFVIPAFKAKFLRQAIQSILDQSYHNFELIIVDDASPEDLFSLVSEFNDERIRFFRNEVNIGGISLVKQWNHCIDYANSDYLILAADDDLYDINFLSTINKLVHKYPECDLFRSRVEIINEFNELIGMDAFTPEYTSKYEYLYYWLNATIFTCIGNYVFRTSEIKRKKFVDFPYAFGSDTASTIYMSENGVAHTTTMLFKFRISSIHLSSNKDKLKEKLEANNQLFEWFKKLNYSVPSDQIDLYCYRQARWDQFYEKYRYDCYNLVVRYLSLKRVGLINQCRLLTVKDKLIMGLRFLKDKIT